MIDLINFLVGCACSFVVGMALHSVLGHYCKTRPNGWICRLFHHNDEVKTSDVLQKTIKELEQELYWLRVEELKEK